MTNQPLDLDVVIFGGGASGLWLLDELVRAGHRTLLLETGLLGSGQTVASQGIIHGGLKYTLTGALTGSAKAIREMPRVWRECLAGQRQPNLRATRVRARHCHLWRTESMRSRAGMIGARAGLRVKPVKVAPDDRPPPLVNCPGDVMRLDEQVIAPQSFIDDLANQHRQRLLKVDAETGLNFAPDRGPESAGEPARDRVIQLNHPTDARRTELRARHIVLLAGAGNESLQAALGLPASQMQRRPLHMVMLRGDPAALPPLNGHCTDGAATRVTITSDKDAVGRTVWQVGGQISEVGVEMQPAELVRHAKAELGAVLPDSPAIDWARVEWATYRVDRAEGATPNGRRPEDVRVVTNGRILTGWPTKLALVPDLVRQIIACLPQPAAPDAVEPVSVDPDWPRPTSAPPPWETQDQWYTDL